MGFFEDDRVRSKNRFQNEAFQAITDLRDMGYSDTEIEKHLNIAIKIQNSDDMIRLNIYKTALDIIRSLNEKEDSTR